MILKPTLINDLSDLTGFTKTDTERFLRAFSDLMQNYAANRDEVYIPRFGILKYKKLKKSGTQKLLIPKRI